MNTYGEVKAQLDQKEHAKESFRKSYPVRAQENLSMVCEKEAGLGASEQGL